MTAALRVELDSADTLLLDSGMTIHKLMPLHIVFDDGRAAVSKATYDIEIRRLPSDLDQHWKGEAFITQAHDFPPRSDLRWVPA